MTPLASHPLLPMHVALLDWYTANGRKSFPWRRVRKPFAILLAEILLQRTNAGKVANYFNAIYQKIPNLEHLLALTQKELEEILKPLGLYQRRAANMILLAKELRDNYKGRVPRTYEQLASLMGLGDYIPRAVQCFAWGQRVAVVDLNVIRIFARMFSIKPKSMEDPRRTPQITVLAEDLLPPTRYVKKYNWALLDLGALICKSMTPLCEECPLSPYCDFFKTQYDYQCTANTDKKNT